MAQQVEASKHRRLTPERFDLWPLYVYLLLVNKYNLKNKSSTTTTKRHSHGGKIKQEWVAADNMVRPFSVNDSHGCRWLSLIWGHRYMAKGTVSLDCCLQGIICLSCLIACKYATAVEIFQHGGTPSFQNPELLHETESMKKPHFIQKFPEIKSHLLLISCLTVCFTL